MAVVPGGRPRDEWDDIPDDELHETLLERLVGLGEAFPESLRNAASQSLSLSYSAVTNGIYYARQTVSAARSRASKALFALSFFRSDVKFTMSHIIAR